MTVLEAFPEAAAAGSHILQTAAWGELKSAFGWRTARVGGALMLFRPLPGGFSLGYIPRGPQVDWADAKALHDLQSALDREGRARRAICLKVEPDLPDSPACADTLTALGYRPSPHAVQPRRSLVVDLSGSEAEVLGRMKPKTRYNIGLAARKEVAVRPAQGPADMRLFNQLIQVTGQRDGFGVHAPAYYQRAYDLFQPAGQVELFLAEFNGQILAGVMAFALGERAWYFYGASSNQERNRMAPYAAQWAAMQWARARGALSYDLWGVPDEPEETLEAEFEQRHDGLWGVYRFKRGFGGRLVRTAGAWDRVYSPLGYAAYLGYLRWRGGSADG